jgi:hypothetical protein
MRVGLPPPLNAWRIAKEPRKPPPARNGAPVAQVEVRAQPRTAQAALDRGGSRPSVDGGARGVRWHRREVRAHGLLRPPADRTTALRRAADLSRHRRSLAALRLDGDDEPRCRRLRLACRRAPHPTTTRPPVAAVSAQAMSESLAIVLRRSVPGHDAPSPTADPRAARVRRAWAKPGREAPPPPRPTPASSIRSRRRRRARRRRRRLR